MTKDYRVRVTKMLIRKEFIVLLQTKPVYAITVRQLCERTGINRSTFYNHYADVYTLLEEIENEMLDKLRETLVSIKLGGELLPSEFFCKLFEFLVDNSDICAAVLGENGDKRLLSRMLKLGKESCLKAYAIQFPQASEDQIEDFYAFVSNGCIGLLGQWIRGGMKKTSGELAETARSLMTGALEFFRR